MGRLYQLWLVPVRDDVRWAYESTKPRWKVQRNREESSTIDVTGAALRCARCGANITDDDARIERAGLHEHSQVNAHGFIWVFGCFATAPGARHLGESTDEFTWFVGYRWRLAECRACGFHLGWRFEREDDSFWGLILERLVGLD